MRILALGVTEGGSILPTFGEPIEVFFVAGIKSIFIYSPLILGKKVKSLLSIK